MTNSEIKQLWDRTCVDPFSQQALEADRWKVRELILEIRKTRATVAWFQSEVMRIAEGRKDKKYLADVLPTIDAELGINCGEDK